MAKIRALIDSIPFIESPQIIGLPLIAVNLLKFHEETNWLTRAHKRLNKKRAVHTHSERMLAQGVSATSTYSRST